MAVQKLRTLLSLLLAQAEDEVQGLFSDICLPSSFEQADVVLILCPWPFTIG